MYTLVSALGVSSSVGSKWGNISIGNVALSTLFTLYRKVYITLSNPLLPANVVIDLESLRTLHSGYNDTFNNFLISNGNTTLETIIAPITLNPKYAQYTDAFRAGYKIDITQIQYSFDTPALTVDKKDIRITRNNPNTDMGVFNKNCLVSINGFFHNTDYDGTYCYVPGGSLSLFKSRQNQVGITSFLDIGEITRVPITSSMITNDSTTALVDKAFISLPNDTTNKVVLIVIGGYLIFPSANGFFKNNDHSFVLNLNKYELLNKYFESSDYLNFTALGLPTSTVNPSLINVPEFFSDTVIRKYLTLPQSFFVIVNTTNLFTNKIYLRNSKLPGMFTSYIEPKYPLFCSNGRIGEYWKVQDDGHWAVNIVDSNTKNYVFSYSSIDSLNVIGDSTIPYKPYYNSKAFLLEIGRDF